MRIYYMIRNTRKYFYIMELQCMYKKSIHQNVITLLVLFIAVTSIMLAFGSDVFSSQSTVSLDSLDEGYSISARNEVLESVSLSSFHIKNII